MKPFAAVCQERSHAPDKEIAERAFATLNRWAHLSSGKLVSLDEVAWLGALMYKSGAMALSAQRESIDQNGARVVTVVANDGIRTADGAG